LNYIPYLDSEHRKEGYTNLPLGPVPFGFGRRTGKGFEILLFHVYEGLDANKNPYSQDV